MNGTPSSDDNIDSLIDDNAAKIAQTYKKNLEAFIKDCDTLYRKLSGEDADARKCLKKVAASAGRFRKWAKRELKAHDDDEKDRRAGRKTAKASFLLAMAVATWIQMDAHQKMADLTTSLKEKMTNICDGLKAADDIVDSLRQALKSLIDKTSLLEIALDYFMPLTAYMTLLITFRARGNKLCLDKAHLQTRGGAQEILDAAAHDDHSQDAQSESSLDPANFLWNDEDLSRIRYKEKTSPGIQSLLNFFPFFPSCFAKSWSSGIRLHESCF